MAARPKRRAKCKSGEYVHPLARQHKPGSTWPERTVARVVNFAMFHSVAAAARHFYGIPYDTIANWIVEAAKPTPEKHAADLTRMQRIKAIGEQVIYEQIKRILKRLRRAGGDNAPLTDQAAVARELAKALNMLGATAQRLEIADTTEDVRTARRRADKALEDYEHGRKPRRV